MAFNRLEAQVAAWRSAPAPSIELVDGLVGLTRTYTHTNLLRALTCAKEALAFARLLRYPAGVAESLVRLSWLHLQMGEFDAAVLAAREGHFLAQRLQDYSLITGALSMIARTQQLAENFVQAERQWQELLDMAYAHNDSVRQADFLTMLGILYKDHGRYQEALEREILAHEIYAASGDANHIVAKNNIATTLIRLSRYDDALAWAEQALAACHPSLRIWHASILHTLGVVRMHLRQHAEAFEHMNASLALSCAEGGRLQTATEVLLDLSKLALIRNQLPEAFDALYRAVDYAQRVGATKLQADAHHALYRLYTLSRSTDLANEHHEHHLQLQHQLGCKRMQWQIEIIRIDAQANQQQPVWLQESQNWVRAAA